MAEKIYRIKFDTNAARRSLKVLQRSAEKFDKVIDKIGGSVKDMGKDLKTTGKTAKKSLGDDATRAAKKLEKATKEAAKRVKILGDRFKKVGRNLTRYFTLPVAAAGVASLKFAMDFNRGMARVATLLPDQLGRVKQLKSEIQALSVESGIATEDLTNGAYAAISAWGDGADTMERMKIVTKAAQAGIATTAETLDLFTSLTEIFGDNSAKAVEHYADLAFIANKLAIKAPFSEMAASMGKTAAVAKFIGVNAEDMFATLTAAAGVSGATVSQVATQMESFYSSIIKQTDGMTKVVKKTNKELGTSFESASEMLSKLGALKTAQQIKKYTKNVSEFREVLGGRKEGLVLAATLVESRFEKYNQAMDVMSTKSGQMREAHKEITDGIDKEGHSWRKTKARMLVFAQRVGDRLLPILGKFLRALEPLFKRLENMSEASMEWGLKLLGLGAIIGPAITTVGLLIGPLSRVGGLLSTATVNTGNFAGSLGTLTGHTAGLSRLTKGIIGLGGALGAFGAGYQIGTMLHETVFKPLSEAGAEGMKSVETALFRSEQAREFGTPEERKAALGELTISERRAEKARYTPENIIGSAIHYGTPFGLLTDAPSIGERIEKKKTEIAAERKLLGTEIARDRAAAWHGERFNPKYGQEMRARIEAPIRSVAGGIGGGAGANITIEGTKIVIEGSVNDKEIRKLKREIDRGNSKNARRLQKLAAAEQ
jgi:TP901 family phage tail tape measure protein